MKRAHFSLGVLAFGHGLNDFIAGHLLAISASQGTLLQSGIHFLIYASLAFAGQIPAALLIDRFAIYRATPFWCWILLIAAVLLLPISMTASVILSGIASAFYHAGGGAVVLTLPLKTGMSSGIFSAPGIIGLTIGSGFTDFSMSGIILLATLPALLCLLWHFFPAPLLPVPTRTNAHREKTDAHDLLMILLLLVISLRSALWDIAQAAHEGDTYLLLGIALAAAAGKIIGGFLSDRLGQMRTLGATLFLSVILLHLNDKNKFLLFSGVALLQATIPASIQLVRQLMPELPALANAFVLGLAVMLGSYPQWIQSDNMAAITAGSLLLVFGLMWWKMRQTELFRR
jgi:MFS transporter, FSR family, fosmidomycin resistance protein